MPKSRTGDVVAEALRDDGEYRIELPADPPHHVVDSWWASHAAGRSFGALSRSLATQHHPPFTAAADVGR